MLNNLDHLVIVWIVLVFLCVLILPGDVSLDQLGEQLPRMLSCVMHLETENVHVKSLNDATKRKVSGMTGRHSLDT